MNVLTFEMIDRLRQVPIERIQKYLLCQQRLPPGKEEVLQYQSRA
jgi:hypothetical protein